MTGYNPLNRVKVNLESVGICQIDGMRFTDPNCPHGTPEQIAHCKAIDERMDNEDIFGHPTDAWLSSRSFVCIPRNDHHSEESLPAGERIAIAYGQSELPHDAESHVIGLGVDFDIKAMGDNARTRSNEIKSRMAARLAETKRKNKAGDEQARSSIRS